MPKPKTTESTCPLCDAVFSTPMAHQAHVLVAHGPPAGATPRKRRRARAALPRIHRKLEEVGFDEAQAHLIIKVAAEELRKAGAL